MRVLLLGPFPPPHGGVQTNLAGIRSHLLRNGIPCSVINLTRHRREDSGGVYYPKSALETVTLLFRLPWDIAHLHIGGNLSTRLLVLGLLCSLIPGKKTVLTFHSGGYPSSPQGWSARPATFCGFALRRFAALIAVNQDLAALFRRFGAVAGKIRVIPPFALLGESGPVDFPESMAGFFAQRRPVLVTIGLFDPEYGISTQVDAFEAVLRQYPEAGLAILGFADPNSPVAARIASKPYSGRILICGDVPHPVAMRALEQCDLFLRTTLYDGDAISVREALHRGVPVVATDNGMRPPGVDLVPMSDSAALAAAILRRLASPRTRPAATAAADTGNLDALLDLYREIWPR